MLRPARTSVPVLNQLGDIDPFWLIVGVLLLIALGGLWMALRSLRIYLALPTNTNTDISRESRATPPQLNEAIEQLTGLGFRRLGEYATYNAQGQELGAVWCYISGDGRIVVEMTPFLHRALVQFSTLFQNYALVETMYPAGETINLPDYRSHHSKISLQAAYQHHLDLLGGFAEQHGAPLVVRDMAHNLELAAVCRTRYGRLKLRRPLIQSFTFPLFFVGIAVILVLMQAMPDLATPIFMAGFSILLQLMPLLLPAPRRAVRVLRVGLLALLICIPLDAVTVWAGIAYLLGLAALLIYYLKHTSTLLESMTEKPPRT